MAEKEYIITLVRSAQGGDSASFAELYNLYYQKVFAFIRTIVRNSADAEDIFQNVFLKYVLSSVVFESAEHEKAWLIRVTMNACKDHLRSFFRSRAARLLVCGLAVG